MEMKPKTNTLTWMLATACTTLSIILAVTYIQQPSQPPKTQNPSTTPLQKNEKTLDVAALEQLFDLGDKEFNNDNAAKALEYYRKALSQHPYIANALIRMGRTFAKLEKHDLAIAEYKSAIAISPRHAPTYAYLAKSLKNQKQFEQAILMFEEALKLDPSQISTYIDIAQSYIDLEQFDKAQPYIDQAKKLDPNNAFVYLTEGHLHNWKGNIETAIEMYKKATQVNPTLAGAHYNLGHTLKTYGKMNEAIEALHVAHSLNSHHVDTHIALSHAYWALGDFENAWKEYEWRWQSYKHDPRIKIIPEWKGEDVNNKTIMLYCEQGLGDTLQFIRYAQELKKQGATVWCKVQKPLHKLLSLVPYIDKLVTHESDDILREKVDYQAALMSMPGLMKTTPATIPSTIPYLYADNSLVDVWKKNITDKNLKVGLCWYVDQKHEIHKLPISKRSIPVDTFTQLSQQKDFSFYCLQKLSKEQQRNIIPENMKINVFSENFDDSNGAFMDSAALIKQLDLVITVDTSIAHLAAGLGKPVWMLLPYSSDCRWYHKPSSSPWYPEMRIFRQPKPYDWKSVMNSIAEELNTLKKEVRS